MDMEALLALIPHPGVAAGMGDTDALRMLGDLSVVLSAVEAAVIGFTGELMGRSESRVREDNVARRLGYVNGIDMLRQVSKASGKKVRSWAALSKAINPTLSLTGETIAPRVPHIADALATGLLPVESAIHIASMLNGCATVTMDELDAAARFLIEQATCIDMNTRSKPPVIALHADDMKIACYEMERHLDPDGQEPDDDLAAQKRGITLGPFKDGLVTIKGHIIPEAAAGFQKLCEATSKPGNDDGSDDPAASDGSNLWDNLAETRTGPQHAHDVFAACINVAMKDNNVPHQGGAPITVMIQVTQETLDTNTGTGLLHAHDGRLHPVSLNTVNRAACTGTIQHVYSTKAGRIIGLESPQRCFTSHQRRAITLRDQKCVIPGCHYRPSWCDIHHVIEHSQNGPTHTDNGVLLCHHHHATINTNGWTITMPHGTPHITPPPWLTHHHKPPDIQLTG